MDEVPSIPENQERIRTSTKCVQDVPLCEWNATHRTIVAVLTQNVRSVREPIRRDHTQPVVLASESMMKGWGRAPTRSAAVRAFPQKRNSNFHQLTRPLV
jgi:hypothetical protein